MPADRDHPVKLRPSHVNEYLGQPRQRSCHQRSQQAEHRRRRHHGRSQQVRTHCDQADLSAHPGHNRRGHQVRRCRNRQGLRQQPRHSPVGHRPRPPGREQNQPACREYRQCEPDILSHPRVVQD
jgi:hypothetical protein